MALAPFLDALLACDLLAAELTAKIKAKLPAANAAELEELIAIARPEKLQAVVTAYVAGLVKAEKAEAKRKRDREGIAARRAAVDTATRATSATRATARQRDTHSLSLEVKFRSEEREKGKGGAGERGQIPLPSDWQPDDASKAAVVAEGVDGAALTANFKDHYGTRPQDMRTPAEWQATYRKWARSERKRGPSLRLVRAVESAPRAPPAPNRGWQPGMPTHEEMLKQYGGGDG